MSITQVGTLQQGTAQIGSLRYTQKQQASTCEVETSMGLELQPDIVRGEALEEGKLRSSPLPYSNVLETSRVSVQLSFEEITSNGAPGDAHEASEAFGRRLTEAVVQRSVEFLERFLEES